MTELTFIHLFQSLHNRVLDWFFTVLTLLGSGEFYLLAVPVIYWCYNKRTGYQLGIIFLVSMFINNWLKFLINKPRPLASEVRVLLAGTATGPSFPSGHAQGSATFWGFLASKSNNRRFQMLAVALVILISLSRVYLGLHYPTDILAGMALGFAFVLAGGVIIKRAASQSRSWFRKSSALAVAAVILPLVLLTLHPTAQGAKLTGSIMGMSLGYLLTLRYNNFTEVAPVSIQVLKIITGVLILILIKTAGKYLLPSHFLAEGLRYLILTFTSGCLVPWLYVSLGWAKRE